MELYNMQQDLTAFFRTVDCRSRIRFEQSHLDLASFGGDNADLSLVSLRRNEDVVLYNDSTHTAHDDRDLSKDKSIKGATDFFTKSMKLGGSDSKTRKIVLKDGFDSYQREFPFMCSSHKFYCEGRLYASKIDSKGRVYLSNYGVASNTDVIKVLGITHVVNCTVVCPFCTDIDQATALEVDAEKMLNHIEDLKLSFPAAKQLEASCYGSEQSSSRLDERISVHQNDHVLLQKLRVPVVDERDNQIKNYFDKANNFIESALRENECNRVLIHCKHGQSRSATIAAAWLVALSSHSVSSALSHLKYCRPKVRPNDGFIQQLHDFGSSIISK